MSVGDIAGLIAAIAFVALVGLLALPLVKLGKVFDEAARSVREITDNSVPILNEAKESVVSVNNQLDKVDAVTTSAAQMAENASALVGLYATVLGRPIIKMASLSYGARQAFASAKAKHAARKAAKAGQMTRAGRRAK